VSPPLRRSEAADVSSTGELRYGLELTRLVVDREFRRPGRRSAAPPALLVPGFMAGDQSLSILGGWLRRRGSETSSAGIRLNVDCSERGISQLEQRLDRLVRRVGRRAVVIGQSRGGEQARVLAVRNPDRVGALVMLGAPVLRPLHVGRGVLRAVRSVARLGDLGVPGFFSTECGEGACCAAYRDDLAAPIPRGVRAVSIYSRSDGVVSWEACLDPCAEHIEVDSSHTGMSVNLDVYRVLSTVLDQEEARWSG
jgi:pimeloyl-ACP methyl ester carboxylesterase